MFQETKVKRRRTNSPSSSNMADGEESAVAVGGLRVKENPEHGMKVLQGLNQLKKDKVLCDVTLIAEGKFLIKFLLSI